MRGDELRFCQLPAHEGSEPVEATHEADGFLLCATHAASAFHAGLNPRPLAAPSSGGVDQ